MSLPDSAVRSLGVLQKTASTSRVLNLLAVAEKFRSTPEYALKPFFMNKFLNESFIIKHRLRKDERFVFRDSKHIATKIIIPFDRSDLSLGGKSFFVGQKGWHSLIQDLAGQNERVNRDITVLEALDEIASLDPFLMREHLIRRNYSISEVYFSISEADISRMHAFVSAQTYRLIDLAFPNAPDINYRKMATAIMSNTVDESLEPLRGVFHLDIETYREGIFSWKGILYYKWAMADMAPKLARVLKELPHLKAIGSGENKLKPLIERSRGRIMSAVRKLNREVLKAIEVYDDAYKDLTANDKPQAFRDFLIRAPALFLVIGETIGSLSHLSSFWRYRFPDPNRLMAPEKDVFEVLADFEADLGISDDLIANPEGVWPSSNRWKAIA